MPLAADGVQIPNATLFGSFMAVDTVGVFSLTSTTGAPAFTWTLNNPGSGEAGFVPANGDKVIWPPYNSAFATNTQIPGGFSSGTAYYALNVSGNTFDLAATPGGTRIPVTAGNVSYPGDGTLALVAAAPSSTGIGAGYPAPDGYLSNFLGHMNYMIAAGVTGLSPVAADTATRFNSMLSLLSQTKDGFYKSNPKYAVGSSF